MAALLAMWLAGCASTAPAPPASIAPIPGWSRPLCSPNAVAVTSPWDAEVQELFARILIAADHEVHRRAPVVVVVDGERIPSAFTCGHFTSATVALSARMLRAASTWPADMRRLMIATDLSHELAHVALHQERGIALPLAVKEAEADALGVYYLERAGFDCRKRVAGIGLWARGGYAPEAAQRATVSEACEGAKRGQRPTRERSR
jgi:hypothetical protein